MGVTYVKGRVGCGMGLAASLLLTGCFGQNFFVQPTSTTTTTGTSTGSGTTNTGDYAYVANSTAGTTYLSEYVIGSSTLSSLGTINLGYIPVALAVSPSNSFLYVASVPGATSPGIYLYNIASGGALSVANGGAALATDTVSAMAISPDGNWLFTVNVDGITMTEYSVNTTTGALTVAGVLTIGGLSCLLGSGTPVSQTCSVTVGPSGAYVMVSLGTVGSYVYPYSSSGGISETGVQAISTGSSAVGNFSAALDANNYAYVAQSNSVSVYGIGASTITSEGTVALATGSVPRSITLSKNYGYLYTANEGAGTISAYGIGGSGALTQISGSPLAGPANVSALAADNTGDYIVAVGYDASAGVRLYTIGSNGLLTQVAETGSGTNRAYPALVAVTH